MEYGTGALYEDYLNNGPEKKLVSILLDKHGDDLNIVDLLNDICFRAYRDGYETRIHEEECETETRELKKEFP